MCLMRIEISKIRSYLTLPIRIGVFVLVMIAIVLAILPQEIRDRFIIRTIYLLGYFSPCIFVSLAVWWLTFNIKYFKRCIFFGSIITTITMTAPLLFWEEHSLAVSISQDVATKISNIDGEVDFNKMYRAGKFLKDGSCITGLKYRSEPLCIFTKDGGYYMYRSGYYTIMPMPWAWLNMYWQNPFRGKLEETSNIPIEYTKQLPVEKQRMPDFLDTLDLNDTTKKGPSK